jgi:uncharacterized membrane protein
MPEVKNKDSLEPGLEKRPRLMALDALRGLIMVLMALDHANYFVAQKHSSGEHWGGPFPAYEGILAFLTRFVTHPVAPGFSFLMGIGMVLFAQSRRERGWREWAITRHFLIRGLLLIVLQLTIVNLAWSLGPVPFPRIYIGVLFALGGGMVFGSFLVHLKARALLILTGVLFVGIELTHPDPGEWGQIFDQPLGLLLGYSGGDFNFWSNYPILPWLELVTFGMLFGHWLLTNPQRAFRRGLLLAGACLLAFVAIRGLDGFGNIRPRGGDTWIDFLNVVKYPPAMTFTLLMMGINLVILRFFAWMTARWPDYVQVLIVFGQVPLFFYVLHLYLYAGMGQFLAPSGTSIQGMYLYWLLGLAVLYPLCLWYGRAKRRQPANSIWRFL